MGAASVQGAGQGGVPAVSGPLSVTDYLGNGITDITFFAFVGATVSAGSNNGSVVVTVPSSVTHKFAATITGDGSTTTFLLSHNLNLSHLTDFVWSCYNTTSTPIGPALPDVVPLTNNTCNVIFAVAPSPGTSYRFVAIG